MNQTTIAKLRQRTVIVLVIAAAAAVGLVAALMVPDFSGRSTATSPTQQSADSQAATVSIAETEAPPSSSVPDLVEAQLPVLAPELERVKFAIPGLADSIARTAIEPVTIAETPAIRLVVDQRTVSQTAPVVAAPPVRQVVPPTPPVVEATPDPPTPEPRQPDVVPVIETQVCLAAGTVLFSGQCVEVVPEAEHCLIEGSTAANCTAQPCAGSCILPVFCTTEYLRANYPNCVFPLVEDPEDL